MQVAEVGGALAVFTDARACPRGFSAEALPSLLEVALGFSAPILIPQQRHTDLVFTFSGTPPPPGATVVVGVCDALMTTERGVALAVQTADCLPVVLAGNGAAGIVHAGWRGLAAGILGRTVRLLAAQFGVGPQTLQAMVGVGIGPCHYPVGAEVLAALREQLGTLDGVAEDGRVDLQAAARLALVRAGVSPARIRYLEGCTACTPNYHSYRRDGPMAGRQWTAVVLPHAQEGGGVD